MTGSRAGRDHVVLRSINFTANSIYLIIIRRNKQRFESQTCFRLPLGMRPGRRLIRLEDRVSL